MKPITERRASIWFVKKREPFEIANIFIQLLKQHLTIRDAQGQLIKNNIIISEILDIIEDMLLVGSLSWMKLIQLLFFLQQSIL